MAFKAIPTKAEAQVKRKPPRAPGSWKANLPSHISAEDAEREPAHLRLFPDE